MIGISTSANSAPAGIVTVTDCCRAVDVADSAEAVQSRRALSALGEADGAPDDEAEAALRLVRTQLSLLWLQLDALREHAQAWLVPEVGAAPSGGAVQAP